MAKWPFQSGRLFKLTESCDQYEMYVMKGNTGYVKRETEEQVVSYYVMKPVGFGAQRSNLKIFAKYLFVWIVKFNIQFRLGLISSVDIYLFIKASKTLI